MPDLIIKKKNSAFIILVGEPSILQELSDQFSFFADGFRFMKAYKSKIWDGRVKLLHMKNSTTGEIYQGLLEQIIQYCDKNHYTYDVDEQLTNKPKIPKQDIIDYINSLNLSYKSQLLNVRDYQLDGIYDLLNNKTRLYLSCVSSGKSLIIYTLLRYLMEQNIKCLLVVPNISLVHQMYTDFSEYSTLSNWNCEDNVHKIFSGQDKVTSKLISISTFQSLHTIKNNSWFEQFGAVFGDEIHMGKCMSIVNIFSKCLNAYYRAGFTGTLDGIKANEKTIIGLTGPINKLNTTKELMDKGQVAKFKIKCLVLKYDDDVCKAVRKFKYQDEIKFIVSNKSRNQFIKNLALSLDKNSIILVNFIETHGQVLFDMIRNSKHLKDRKVYFIHGGVAGEERERIRQIVEVEKDSIIVASSAIMGAGISIKNLHNIIFAISGKSRIRTLQSIGRVLRLHTDKEVATLYDIADNLSTGKHRNFSIQHFLERVKMYNQEQFEYKVLNIPFNK